MSRALAAALEKLLAAPAPDRVAATLFTPAQRRALDAFARQTGALRLVTQGNGVSYQVRDRALALLHCRQLRPTTQAGLSPDLPARAGNIARMRDSKARAHGHAIAYLLLKAIGPGVRWERGDGVGLDLSQATRDAGVAAIAISAEDAWHTAGPVWLVENQALFDRLDWLPPEAHGSVLYYGGQLSGLLLAWLGQRARGERLVFFPDYDGVGLLNYCRLRERSRAPVTFWLMPHWQQLLQTYGSNTLWRKTSAQFHRALQRLPGGTMPAELALLCQALAAHGLALEHETVWLTAS